MISDSLKYWLKCHRVLVQTCSNWSLPLTCDLWFLAYLWNMWDNRVQLVHYTILYFTKMDVFSNIMFWTYRDGHLTVVYMDKEQDSRSCTVYKHYWQTITHICDWAIKITMSLYTTSALHQTRISQEIVCAWLYTANKLYHHHYTHTEVFFTTQRCNGTRVGKCHLRTGVSQLAKFYVQYNGGLQIANNCRRNI